MTGGGATWQENALIPITRNGRREDVYWTYSYGPIDDEDAPNGIGGVLVVCTETTQQVLAARQAREERERFAELFEQAPTFMARLTGPEHRFELVNPSYMRLIGDIELLGRKVIDVLPEVAAQGFIELLDTSLSDGRALRRQRGPLRLACPAGRMSKTSAFWISSINPCGTRRARSLAFSSLVWT